MATGKSKALTYENGLLVLLGFTFGIVFFERNAIGPLAAYIIKDLSLNQAEVGMLGSGLSLAWAVSAYVIGAWSDRSGVRKPFLLVSVVVFSLCSALSGIAGTFMLLLLARVVMGFAEGPFLPICFSIMNVESSPKRRGVNAGLMQNFFASLLGTTVAPLVLPWLADQYGWRTAFYLSAIPGLLCAFFIWQFVREPKPVAEVTAAVAAPKPGLFDMLKQRNILVCSGISVFMISWYLVGIIFLPVFFTVIKGMPPDVAGQVVAPMGIATMICGFIVPAISDRIGRKPAMIIFTFIGIVTPLAALLLLRSAMGAEPVAADRLDRVGLLRGVHGRHSFGNRAEGARRVVDGARRRGGRDRRRRSVADHLGLDRRSDVARRAHGGHDRVCAMRRSPEPVPARDRAGQSERPRRRPEHRRLLR